MIVVIPFRKKCCMNPKKREILRQQTDSILPGRNRPLKIGQALRKGCQESDTTERLHFRFSLSCIGEGNGNPLQCSCLESPRDGGACWAAIYGVAQSQTRLKRLSSSSSSEEGSAGKPTEEPICPSSCQ